MERKMLNKIERELNIYAIEEWGDFSYSIDNNGVISESYSGDGDYGYVSVSTGATCSVTSSTEELLKFFNNDEEFVRIIKDIMVGYSKVDEYEGPDDDPDAFMAWFNSDF